MPFFDVCNPIKLIWKILFHGGKVIEEGYASLSMKAIWPSSTCLFRAKIYESLNAFVGSENYRESRLKTSLSSQCYLSQWEHYIGNKTIKRQF